MKQNYKKYSESELRSSLEELFQQWDAIRSGKTEGAAISDGFRLNSIRQEIIIVKERLKVIAPMDGQLYFVGCSVDAGTSNGDIQEVCMGIESREVPPELPITFSCCSNYWAQRAKKIFCVSP